MREIDPSFGMWANLLALKSWSHLVYVGRGHNNYGLLWGLNI
jgi:hypothetical protein